MISFDPGAERRRQVREALADVAEIVFLADAVPAARARARALENCWRVLRGEAPRFVVGEDERAYGAR